jgi:predicted membrane protein
MAIKSENWKKSMWVGMFFVLLGISIILKVLFKIDFPMFRILFAIFLIYLGVRLLTGFSNWDFRTRISKGDKESVVFGSGKMNWDSKDPKHNEFSTVFGSSTVDLTQAQLAADGIEQKVDINSVFAETTVLLSPKVPVRVRMNSAFAEARMPDGNMVAFGTLHYSTHASDIKPVLQVNAHAVFGSMRFVTMPGDPVADKMSQDKGAGSDSTTSSTPTPTPMPKAKGKAGAGSDF